MSAPEASQKPDAGVLVVIVAAGTGSRIGEGVPKQYREIAGKSVLRRTLEAFVASPDIDRICVVIRPEDKESYWRCAEGLPKLEAPVHGGRTRQESVLCGLEAFAARPPRIVLIHDAARPFVSAELIARIVQNTSDEAGVVPALKATDTLKRVAGDRVAETVPREAIVAAQTPQAFSYPGILAAHRRVAAEGLEGLTDDAAVAEAAGLTVRVVKGDPRNTKLTLAADLERADRAMRQMETRTGQGFDVHAFGPGDHVWICGLRIPHEQSLVGHSDADVGLHALTDAILGALGDGDIGVHFPPSDPQWKGASSDRFLVDAARRVAERKGRILHVDLTILCERPKISPHREAMRRAVADMLDLPLSRVSVKATTTEQMGFVGRQEGMAAMAVATIELPTED